MLRNVNSQTNVKIGINYVIDNQNMQEHNNNKELGILSLKVTYISIREYPNLRHRSPSSSTKIRNFKILALFCDCTGWFVSDLFGNHIVGFSTRRFI